MYAFQCLVWPQIFYFIVFFYDSKTIMKVENFYIKICSLANEIEKKQKLIE